MTFTGRQALNGLTAMFGKMDSNIPVLWQAFCHLLAGHQRVITNQN